MATAQTPSGLAAALAGEPWAVTDVMRSIDHIRDDNGRPLGERRAPADSRRDVDIELSACPYNDERHGKLMNRPALEPTMRQFAAVAAHVAAFHAALPPAAPSWSRMLWAVLDQYAAPARYLLTRRQGDGPIPADISAGHKLAAGYFGALVTLLREHAAGAALPEASTESFAELVATRGALLGASEVCAGPPHNIRVLSRLFLHGADKPSAEPAEPVAQLRVTLARGLADQVRLGLAWAVYDEVTERALLLESDAPRALATKTAYLADRLQTRAEELLAKPAPKTRTLGTLVPPYDVAARLGPALSTPQIDLSTTSERGAIARLLSYGEAAVVLPEEQRPAVIGRLANVLCRYRLLVQAQWHIEQTLRAALGYPLAAGFTLSPLLCPRPRALEWLEIFTGHNLQLVPGAAAELTLRNHRRSIAFA